MLCEREDLRYGWTNGSSDWDYEFVVFMPCRLISVPLVTANIWGGHSLDSVKQKLDVQETFDLYSSYFFYRVYHVFSFRDRKVVLQDIEDTPDVI
jgi:hypothetical protein